MSRTFRRGERHIRVRGIRRPTDLKRLACTLIELEAARAEAEAEAEHRAQSKTKRGKRQRKEPGA
jgi:hypothetical protein